jgi:hypothetical protein
MRNAKSPSQPPSSHLHLPSAQPRIASYLSVAARSLPVKCNTQVLDYPTSPTSSRHQPSTIRSPQPTHHVESLLSSHLQAWKQTTYFYLTHMVEAHNAALRACTDLTTPSSALNSVGNESPPSPCESPHQKKQSIIPLSQTKTSSDINAEIPTPPKLRSSTQPCQQPALSTDMPTTQPRPQSSSKCAPASSSPSKPTWMTAISLDKRGCPLPSHRLNSHPIVWKQHPTPTILLRMHTQSPITKDVKNHDETLTAIRALIAKLPTKEHLHISHSGP